MLEVILLSLIFILWWLPSLILKFDFTVYNLFWLIIYIIISIGIFNLFKKQKICPRYICWLLLCYIYHFSFRVFFVYYQNTLYSLVVFIIGLLISLAWYFETKKIDRLNSLYLLAFLFAHLSLGLLFIYH